VGLSPKQVLKMDSHWIYRIPQNRLTSARSVPLSEEFHVEGWRHLSMRFRPIGFRLLLWCP